MKKGNCHVGEKNIATNGLEMEIIAWRGAKDIDVRFEDGTVVTNRQYIHFKEGRIRNSNVCVGGKVDKKNRVGQKITNKYGQTMEIIAYRGCLDIDVRFDDGTIVTNRKYYEFEAAAIANKVHYGLFLDRIGEEVLARNGQKMKIIAIRNAKDIDVEFDDGTVVKNVVYSNFKKGLISNPNNTWYKTRVRLIKESLEGKGKYSTYTGEYAKVIKYEGDGKVRIQFKNGVEKVILTPKFLKGKFYSCATVGEAIKIRDAKKRVGEHWHSTYGQDMKIIAYRSSQDIDVEFEDGTVVEHTTYGHFTYGYIRNPNFKK